MNPDSGNREGDMDTTIGEMCTEVLRQIDERADKFRAGEIPTMNCTVTLPEGLELNAKTRQVIATVLERSVRENMSSEFHSNDSRNAVPVRYVSARIDDGKNTVTVNIKAENEL